MSVQQRALHYGDEEDYEDEEANEEEEEGTKMVPPHLRMANVKGILQIAIPYNLMATCIPSTCTKKEYLVRVTGGACR